MFDSPAGRAFLRFGRAIVCAVVAAAIDAAVKNIGELPISDSGLIALLTAGLLAAGKYLRDKGWSVPF